MFIRFDGIHERDRRTDRQGCRLLTGRYVLGVLCGENRPKSENWATLMPRSSATIRHTEKQTDLGNSLALGLQLLLVCVSFTIIGKPRISVLIRRV